jgi:hypothetical protein
LLLPEAVAEVCLEEVAVVLEVIEIVRLGKQQAVAVLLKVRFRLRLVPTQSQSVLAVLVKHLVILRVPLVQIVYSVASHQPEVAVAVDLLVRRV